MTPIRPNALPPTPHSLPAQDAARLAAQRAFFAAATGQAQAPAATAQPSAPATAAASATPSAEPPERILRPGSLIDIRV